MAFSSTPIHSAPSLPRAPVGGQQRLWEVCVGMTASGLRTLTVEKQQPPAEFRATLPSTLIPRCGVHTAWPPESSGLQPP